MYWKTLLINSTSQLKALLCRIKLCGTKPSFVRCLFFSICVFTLSACSYFRVNNTKTVSDPHQPTIRLQIEGLDGDANRNVRARVSRIQSEEVSNDPRFRARLLSEIKVGLQAVGYYEPTVEFDFEPREPPSRPILFARIEQGEPILLKSIDIRLIGDANQDEAFLQLIKERRPKVGSILNHGEFDALITSLSNLALNRGYFDAQVTQRKLGVALERKEAVWMIEFDSGHRYRYGNITYQGSQIEERFLDNIAPFDQDAPYLADDIIEFNRRLSRTNWFNSVVVSPDLEQLKNKEPLNINSVVSPRSKNSIDVGAGYSTDVGPRGIFVWRRPWWNSLGHSSETSLNISAKEQIADLSYRIPLSRNALEHYYLLQAGLKHQDLNDTKSISSTLNAARFWGRIAGWQVSTNVRLSYDDFTQGAVDNRTFIVSPGFNINRTRTVGSGMPSSGDTQRYSVDFSDRTIGSDVDFAIMQAQYAFIRTPIEKNRLLMRANIGWIETNDFERIPPSLRFFAGGDRSLRGYKFQSISPVDSEGKLAGASQLVTGSLEYQYNFKPSWWSAAFVDAGNASNDVFSDDVKIGAGLGVRWSSPVGPVKFDIATPINDRDTNNVQFYIGLGPEL